MLTKAPEGSVSVNVDASFEVDTMKGTRGAVIRYDRAKFIAASNHSNSSARYSPCQTFPIAESIDVTTERYLATFIPAFPSCLCYLRECL